MTDRFTYVEDDRLRQLINGLFAASHCIDSSDFPWESDAVLAAAEYLVDLRERRQGKRG